MFWSRSKRPTKPLDSDEVLELRVREALGEGCEESLVKVVAAVAGLLATVAYADRNISEAEADHLRAELGRIPGFRREHAEGVANVLTEQAVRLSTAFVPRFTRTLREELPEESRCEVLDALLGMAAVDGAITQNEVVSLRNLSGSLGLSQEHYNALQAKYADQLAWRTSAKPEA